MNCARRRRSPWARCAASPSNPTRSSSVPGRSPSSATRSPPSPTTGPATKSSTRCPAFRSTSRRSSPTARCPLRCRCAEARALRLRSRRARSAHRAEDAAADPEHAAQPDRRPADARGSRGDRRRAAAPSGRLGLRRRDLQQAGLRRRVRVDRLAARHARAHDHFRRRLQDLRDDRLAHRIRREQGAGAGVHALDHQHRIVRIADQPVGRAAGADRAAERRRRDEAALSCAARPDRAPAQRGAGISLRDAGRRVLRLAERDGGVQR